MSSSHVQRNVRAKFHGILWVICQTLCSQEIYWSASSPWQNHIMGVNTERHSGLSPVKLLLILQTINLFTSISALVNYVNLPSFFNMTIGAMCVLTYSNEKLPAERTIFYLWTKNGTLCDSNVSFQTIRLGYYWLLSGTVIVGPATDKRAYWVFTFDRYA